MQEQNNRLTRLISSLCTVISNAYDTIVENNVESSEFDGDDIYHAFANDAEKMIFKMDQSSVSDDDWDVKKDSIQTQPENKSNWQSFKSWIIESLKTAITYSTECASGNDIDDNKEKLQSILKELQESLSGAGVIKHESEEDFIHECINSENAWVIMYGENVIYEAKKYQNKIKLSAYTKNMNCIGMSTIHKKEIMYESLMPIIKKIAAVAAAGVVTVTLASCEKKPEVKTEPLPEPTAQQKTDVATKFDDFADFKLAMKDQASTEPVKNPEPIYGKTAQDVFNVICDETIRAIEDEDNTTDQVRWANSHLSPEFIYTLEYIEKYRIFEKIKGEFESKDVFYNTYAHLLQKDIQIEKSQEGGGYTCGFGKKLNPAENQKLIDYLDKNGIYEKMTSGIAERILMADLYQSYRNAQTQINNIYKVDIDKLTQSQKEMLVELEFNVGNISKKFPKFIKAVLSGNKVKAVAEYTRKGTGERYKILMKHFKKDKGDWVNLLKQDTVQSVTVKTKPKTTPHHKEQRR
jgi:hypothetical protein